MSLTGQFRASRGEGALTLAGAQRQGGAHAGSMPSVRSTAELMERAPQTETQPGGSSVRWFWSFLGKEPKLARRCPPSSPAVGLGLGACFRTQSENQGASPQGNLGGCF